VAARHRGEGIAIRGRRIRVLFVCHYNRKRSATGERVFAKDPALDVRSAGTSDDALVRVNERMLDWADIVFIMEDEQRRSLSAMFPNHAAVGKAVSLQIPDSFQFLDPELVSMLVERTAPHLEKLKNRGPGIN
jgi:predicted protein tyrosine phosphatase